METVRELHEKLAENKKRLLLGYDEKQTVDYELGKESTIEEQKLWHTLYYRAVDLYELDYQQDDRFIWGRCAEEIILFEYATKFTSLHDWMLENNIDLYNLTEEDEVAIKLRW